MIFSLKIIIDEDKNVSLVISKTPELAKLLKSTINVLEISFPHVRITSRNDHYQIAGIEGTGAFSTIKSIIEEVFIRYVDDVDDSEPSEFEKFFMI